MNRKTASAFDSDDSESDWDTTVADSPSRQDPLKAAAVAAPAVDNTVESDSTYATVVAKPRVSLKGSGDDAPSKVVNGRSPMTTPRHDINKSSMASPPPHLTSFKNALSGDLSDSPDAAPSLPPRRYDEGKGQLYTVPESGLMPQADVANWDDSDAEERVLKELQQNIGKEKQRQQQLKLQQQQQQQQQQHQQQQHHHQQQQQHQQQKLQQQQPPERDAKSRERKVTLAAPGEHLPSHSPKVIRSDQWRHNADRGSPPAHKISELSKGDYKQHHASSAPVSSPAMLDEVQPSILKSHGHSKPGFGKASPVIVRDTEGKRYVFYFEEGSPHFLEVEEDDINAFLPDKIEEVERLFRRVWREVFAVLRVLTSFFVLFLSELLHFLLRSVARTLVLDTTIAIGDHLLKPLLTVLFNSVLQPVFALLWNVCNAATHAVDPLLRLTGILFSQIAMVLGAFRLFVVNYSNPPASFSRDVNVV